MRLAAWFRTFLAILTVQPTFASAEQQPPATYVVTFNWSQVQRLRPGTEIMVRKPGVALVRRYVLAVTDDEVKTFAVSDLAVEFARPLRKAALTHPEYLLETQPAGTTIPLGGRVSLKDSGVMVGHRRVAELEQFIVTISRREIDNGSATLSTPPVKNQLSTPAKICLGVGIGFAAFWATMLIVLSQTGVGD